MKFRKLTPFRVFVGSVYLLLTLISINFIYNNRYFRSGKSWGEILVDYSYYQKDQKRFSFGELKTYGVNLQDDGNVIFYTGNGSAYRYGPSIIENEDGSMDAWFSSPGNNGSQWDWIRYRHSSDGIHWSGEQIVLRPTPGSRDQCSVCDPGVIYFNGYYYLAYTATSDYGYRGTNNSAFVARSKNPNGPFEKWNGSGWGGYPKPIIEYTDNPRGWGIGEVSFVIKDEILYVYYTYFDATGGYTSLATSDLSENWPENLYEYGVVCGRTTQDSLDVAYVEDEDVFLAFSIEYRMSESSRLIMYQSKDGMMFSDVDTSGNHIKKYAHNMGIAKDKNGHIRIDKENLIGYAYGGYWGRWSLMMQHIKIQTKKT